MLYKYSIMDIKTKEYTNEKFWLRFFAWNVDSLVLGILLSITSLSLNQAPIVSFVINFLVVFGYYVILEASPLRTSIGKLSFKIDVVPGLYPFNDILKRNIYKMPLLLWLFANNFLISSMSFLLFIASCFYFIKKNQAIYDQFAEVELNYHKKYNIDKMFRWLISISLASILLISALLTLIDSNALTINIKFIIALFLLSGLASHIYALYKPSHLHAQLVIFLPYVLLVALVLLGLKQNINATGQLDQLKDMLNTAGMLGKDQDISSFLLNNGGGS